MKKLLEPGDVIKDRYKINEIIDYLNNELKDVKGIEIPFEAEHCKHVYQMYTIRIQEGIDRDAFVRGLNEKGVGASIHFYPPVHHMKPYQGDQYRKDDLSVTEQVILEIVTLPMYPQMSDDDLGYMVDSIRETITALG